MRKKDLLTLLNDNQGDDRSVLKGDRILLIDGLNLFFRNFAMLQMVNPKGVHIGGLGGFFRSLGALIRQIQPHQVYVIFDGAGSSMNRKNIVPEYKSGREAQRITNWEVFENLEEEHDSKIDQIVRIIQYLKTLPVKTISIDRVEADDIIAYLSHKALKQPGDRAFIISSDKDFLQLVSGEVVVYRPIEKKFYTSEYFREKYNMLPENFIIYKTLMGDNSDKIRGVKGLGEKKLFKLFPELTKWEVSWEDILDICEKKFKDHIIYARIIQEVDQLEKNYKIMDLSNPMMDKNEKEYLNGFVNSKKLTYNPKLFTDLYNEDELGGMIRNLDFWLRENFLKLVSNK